jgi:hypothetical protein
MRQEHHSCNLLILGAIPSQSMKEYRTFGYVETGQKEFPITNSSFSPSGLAHHTVDQVAHEFDMFHRLLRWDMIRHSHPCVVASFQHILVVVVQSINQLTNNRWETFKDVLLCSTYVKDGQCVRKQLKSVDGPKSNISRKSVRQKSHL